MIFLLENMIFLIGKHLMEELILVKDFKENATFRT